MLRAMDLRGTNVLITGGGGGLGCEVTARFCRAGARVTVPVVGDDGARLCAHLGDSADAVVAIPADLTDEPSVAALFDGTIFGAVVHLVGGFSMGAIHEVELAEYRRLVDLNLTTAVLTLKHAVAHMRRAGYGRIVTVASKSAIDPPGGTAIYAATKAAVLALTRSVAAETTDVDVTANCVLPTIIDTEANRKAMGEAEADKWVSPARLAEVLLFLASPAAADLRGTAMRVYGRG
jgi:NAD(P)-dependent dehydrogenase (short-subunit alcohol dehydrogenase family)